MATAQSLTGTVRVENVGGIDETEVSFQPGVTVLAGRNATNRTSFLRAVMAAFGSDRASLKADADEGRVELDLGEETYTRTFSRRNGTVVTGGDPYLEEHSEVELADLFAFVLESNEARRAVARSDDLRELIMRPVDTAAIQNEIDRALRDRNRVDDELEQLDQLSERLPGLEERRQELREEIEAVESELETKRDELEAADSSLEAEREERSQLDEAMSNLQDARGELTRTRQRLETERESVESLEAELEDLREELADLPEPDEVQDAESQLSRLRDRQDRLDDVVSELQSIIEFNESMLDGSGTAVRDALEAGDSGDLSEELLPADEQETNCWTCGSTVEREDIQVTLDRLRSVREDTISERSSVHAEIDELTSKRRERKEQENQRERLERRIERTESELEERRERIEELETEREEIESRIEDLEAEVESLQAEEQSELLELNSDVNELEFERDRLESDLERVEAEIEDVEDRLDERSDLEADRESLTERLEELRGRIDRIEAEAVEAFNEHMEQLLEVLDYDNLERIWIDRQSAGDSRRFELEVVRATPDGAVYDDTIDHLSESEREVTGLVFALAGYLVHDVHETVPVMLLDSLEAIDSDRIATLLSYFDDYADSILVALLPEDAQAVDDDYEYVHEI